MPPTTAVLTAPELGTVIAPIHAYSEDQAAQIEALREVSVSNRMTRLMELSARPFCRVIVCGPVFISKYAYSLLLPASDPYHEWELRWLRKLDTIPRYMRAAKWKMHDAEKRIKSTLEWRREYKPELIPPEEVSKGDASLLLISEHTVSRSRSR